jgi:hypothetical protein
MTQQTTTQLVMGTRLDHVPAPKEHQLSHWRCVSYQQETVTELPYPPETAVVCNVCAPAVIQQLTTEDNAALAFDIPPEAKAEMTAAAARLNMPLEEYLQQFVAWKTGKLLRGRLVNSSLRKQAKR